MEWFDNEKWKKDFEVVEATINQLQPGYHYTVSLKFKNNTIMMYDPIGKKIKILTPMQFKVKDGSFISEIFKEIKLKMAELVENGHGWW